MIGAAIETMDVAVDHRPQPVEAVIAEIGFEPRVQADDKRRAAIEGEGLRAGAENIGGRDMDDVRREPRQVATGRAGQAEREPKFAAHRQRDRPHRDQVARRFERRRVGDGRIDPHRGARMLLEMRDKAVERLVRAFAHIVVISRK